MEQGNAAQFKNKNLDQIDIDVMKEVVDDEDIGRHKFFYFFRKYFHFS